MLGSILGSLVDAGLVEAKRGWHGGYALRAPAQEISVAAVIAAVSGPLKTSDPDALAASAAASASTRNVVDEFWRSLDSGLQTHLSALSLADLVTEVGGRESPARGDCKC